MREKLSNNIFTDETVCNCGCGMGDPLITVNAITKIGQWYKPVETGQNIALLATNIQKLTDILSLRYNEARIYVQFNSWCRCPTWNEHENGSDDSQHLTGSAADCIFKFKRNGQIHVIPSTIICRTAYFLTARGIAAFGGIGAYLNHVHLDVRPGRKVNWYKKPGVGLVYGTDFKETGHIGE